MNLATTWRPAARPSPRPPRSCSARPGLHEVHLESFLSQCPGSWNTIALLRGHGSRLSARKLNSLLRLLPVTSNNPAQPRGVTFPLVLVGHSMGGRVAMQYTDLFPEDLAAVVVEDMDIKPRTSGSLQMQTGRRDENSRGISVLGCPENTLSNWYEEERIEGWRKDGRVFQKNQRVELHRHRHSGLASIPSPSG